MSQRANLETSLSANGLSDVSLITTGIEAQGHGLWLDDKTAEGAMQKLIGKSVKSYLRHDGAESDRLGREIGFFSGIYRAGAQVKATAFQFLESFRKEAAGVVERLTELAAKVPDQFGVSLVLNYEPVWVLADGTELPARAGEAAPSGAIRPLPSMRILDVLSADFVGRPAANPSGLFSADLLASVDAAHPKQTPIMETPATFDQAALDAKLGEARSTLTAELSATHAAALAGRDAEVVKLKADLAALDAAHSAAQAAALATLETAHSAALAALNAELAAQKALTDEAVLNSAAKLGVPPLKYTPALQADLTTPEQKLAYYEKLEVGSPERRAFLKANQSALFAAQTKVA